MRKDQVFLIATHGYSNDVYNKYMSISQAVSDYGLVFLLYHQKENSIPGELHAMNCHLFTDAILHDLSYMPLRNSLIPGSNHFPLLDFFRKNDGFTFYWYIEDDVCFNGDWKDFFSMFNNSSHDFISSYIKKHQPGSQWPWWKLSHPVSTINLENRLRSFNPVYRISQAALSFIDRSLMDQWQGHHEVLLPTLLYNNNFTLLDFGGTGDFISPGNKNKFYTTRTYRWKPAFKKSGTSKNKLYHPVKPVYSNLQQNRAKVRKDVYAVYLAYQTPVQSQVIVLYKKNKRFAIKTLVNIQAIDSENYHHAYKRKATNTKKKYDVITRSEGIWAEMGSQKEIILKAAGEAVYFLQNSHGNILLTGNKSEEIFHLPDAELEQNLLFVV